MCQTLMLQSFMAWYGEAWATFQLIQGGYIILMGLALEIRQAVPHMS